MCFDMFFANFLMIPWYINPLSDCSLGLFPNNIPNLIDIELWRTFSDEADIIIVA